MRYMVTLITTPDDPKLERTRKQRFFQSNDTDQARLLQEGMVALCLPQDEIQEQLLDFQAREGTIRYGAGWTWSEGGNTFEITVLQVAEPKPQDEPKTQVRATLQFLVDQTDPGVAITQEGLQEGLQELLQQALRNYVSQDGQIDHTLMSSQLLQSVRLQLVRLDVQVR